PMRRIDVIAWIQSLAGLLVAATAVQAEVAPPSTAGPQATEFFEKRVRPILAENCFSCHGEKKQKAGLRLDSREALLKGSETGPVVRPGNPSESALIRAVRQDGDVKMPPTGKLPAEAIDALTTWVKLGAPWPEHSKSSLLTESVDPITLTRKSH